MRCEVQRVPHTKRIVAADRGDTAAVGRVGERVDVVDMGIEPLQQWRRQVRGIPNAKRLVKADRGDAEMAAAPSAATSMPHAEDADARATFEPHWFHYDEPRRLGSDAERDFANAPAVTDRDNAEAPADAADHPGSVARRVDENP